jgi:hypothetical protein
MCVSVSVCVCVFIFMCVYVCVCVHSTKIQRVGVRAGELVDFAEFESKYHR